LEEKLLEELQRKKEKRIQQVIQQAQDDFEYFCTTKNISSHIQGQTLFTYDKNKKIQLSYQNPSTHISSTLRFELLAYTAENIHYTIFLKPRLPSVQMIYSTYHNHNNIDSTTHVIEQLKKQIKNIEHTSLYLSLHTDKGMYSFSSMKEILLFLFDR